MTGQAWTACSVPESAPECECWVDQEIRGCAVGHARLAERMRVLLDHMGNALGRSIRFAWPGWANTKAGTVFPTHDWTCLAVSKGEYAPRNSRRRVDSQALA
jgi:hypothetical protein